MTSISWPGTVVVKLGCIKLYQTSKCPKGLNETSVRLKFVFHRLKQSTHENKFVRQDYRIFFVAIHVCEWPLMNLIKFLIISSKEGIFQCSRVF